VDDLRLTPTSFIVLGLLERHGESTPYDFKGQIAGNIGEFWTLQHSQLYSEPERLARGGYVEEEREETGRRRRIYRITAKGREALAEWREDVHPEPTELRDLGLLKLFLGADPAALAEGQMETHRAKLAFYEEMRANAPDDVPEGKLLALEAGIGHERQFLRFWEDVLSERRVPASRSARGG
jgi:DNA-binding PadR family transcriptional regulator